MSKAQMDMSMPRRACVLVEFARHLGQQLELTIGQDEETKKAVVGNNAQWLRSPLATEKKWNQLSDAGWGIRFNMPKMVSVRLDFAWALDKKPSDGKFQRTWFSVSTKF